MLVTECYRIDYPRWCREEEGKSYFLCENEPLGLYFAPADATLSGLRVTITNDAEQIEVHLDSRARLLRPEPDYFGEPTSVLPDSPLHQLRGQALQQIFLGQCTGIESGLLTTAIQLVFERDTLTFFNYADEGCYFLGVNKRLWEAYTKVYEVEWVEYSQWLKLLGTDTTGMPYQLV